jgi:DNA-binding transcriptional MerR regulator
LKRTYGSREVAAITGLTARQLQLWEAGGLMLPAIPTRRTAAGGYTERRYSPIDVLELLVLAELRRLGFSIQQLHMVVRVLKEQFDVRLFDATGGGDAVSLLTDGQRVYARTTSGAFFNLLESPAQPLLVAGDERLLKELGRKGKVRRRKKKRLN